MSGNPITDTQRNEARQLYNSLLPTTIQRMEESNLEYDRKSIALLKEIAGVN